MTNINELRRLWFAVDTVHQGGAEDAEAAFLQTAADQGVTAADLLNGASWAEAADAVIYLSSGAHASDGNSGLTPAHAKATLQSAITAAGAGGKVVAGVGVFTLPAKATWTSGVTIEGSGSGTIFRGSSLGTALIGAATIARTYKVILRNFCVDNVSSAAAGGIGIDFTNVSDGRIENVYITNVETGLLVNSEGSGNGAYYNNFIGVSCAATVDAFKFGRAGSATSSANENHLFGCRVATAVTGMTFDGTTGCSATACSIETTTTAFSVSPTRLSIATGLIHNRIENATNGYLIGALDLSCTILAGHLTSCTHPYTDDSGHMQLLSQYYNNQDTRTEKIKFGDAGGSNTTAIVRWNGQNVIVRNSIDSAYAGMDAGNVTSRGNIVQTAGAFKLGLFGVGAGTVQATGWGSATGSSTRTTFDTTTVTTAQLAEHLKALIDDLKGYGLLGS